MIYQNFKMFQKHIESNFHKSIEAFYLVVINEDFERGQVVDFILRNIPHENSLAIEKFSAPDDPVEKVITALFSPTFFGDMPLIVLDHAEALKKENEKKLLTAFPFPGRLVAGASSKQGIGALFQLIDKHGVILDLSLEKPWDREKRLLDLLRQRCAGAKKEIQMSAANLLLSRTGSEFAALEQEIDKLITYVGERSSIEEKDILAISSFYKENSIWQMAERIVWEKEDMLTEIDSNLFYALIPAVRYNLQMGLKVVDSLERGRSLDFWHLPSSLLSKREKRAKELGKSFFVKALQELFAVEMVSKSGVNNFSSLLELFKAKIYV